jgi:Na+-transporting NADH:ubiquinone oxidoreductase subunit C
MNTIVGASFDHAGETPGLGAEIKDNPKFSANFVGKKIFDEEGEYVSITARKGGAKDPMHDVDGITGATVTADGVTKMMKSGVIKYLPYLKTN